MAVKNTKSMALTQKVRMSEACLKEAGPLFEVQLFPCLQAPETVSAHLEH